MGAPLPGYSGIRARRERTKEGILGILYLAQRERWRSTPGGTPVFAAALASITGNTASASAKTDEGSTQSTVAEGARRPDHIRRRLEFMRTAIYPATSVIIRGCPLRSL